MSLSEFNIVHFETIDSTNSYAINKIQALPHKSVITSDIQTKGRGRLQRQWVSDNADNIYMSVILKPDIDYKKLPLVNFTQLFSVAVCEVFSEYNVVPQIKWPNDVLINNKKCIGIISEAAFNGSSFAGLVVGIGINCSSSPKQEQLDMKQPVSSLGEESGLVIEKQSVLNSVLLNFNKYYDRFCESGFPIIKEKYLSFFPYKGESVEIINSNSNVSGQLIDISHEGELQIDDGSGSLKNIALGDMVWKTY